MAASLENMTPRSLYLYFVGCPREGNKKVGDTIAEAGKSQKGLDKRVRLIYLIDISKRYIKEN